MTVKFLSEYIFTDLNIKYNRVRQGWRLLKRNNPKTAPPQPERFVSIYLCRLSTAPNIYNDCRRTLSISSAASIIERKRLFSRVRNVQLLSENN